MSDAPTIHPDSIYLDGNVRLLLGLPSSTLARARRNRALKFTKQGHKILYRGQWLLDWLEADARQRANSLDSAATNGPPPSGPIANGGPD
jgi:hypothetical protein